MDPNPQPRSVPRVAVSQGVSVKTQCDQTEWKSIQPEQDVCSDNLWTPSHAPVTTSPWAVIPSWHAAEQGFSTARSLLRKPQHICSVAEPWSILCIARLDKLSLLIFKTFHNRGPAWNGEPHVSSTCRGPSALRAFPGKAATIMAWPRGHHVLSAAAKQIYPSSVGCIPLLCIFMFLEQWFCLFFPATTQVLEMLLRTSFLHTPSGTWILLILLRRNCPAVLWLCMLDLVGWGEKKKCVCKVSH